MPTFLPLRVIRSNDSALILPLIRAGVYLIFSASARLIQRDAAHSTHSVPCSSSPNLMGHAPSFPRGNSGRCLPFATALHVQQHVRLIPWYLHSCPGLPTFETIPSCVAWPPGSQRFNASACFPYAPA